MATRKPKNSREKSRGGALASKHYAKWYIDTGVDLARERGLYKKGADVFERGRYLATKRELRLQTLSANLKNLRQVFTGFTSADGYNLHDIRGWPTQRVRKVEQYAEYLNHLRSQPFTIIRPRSKKQKKALEQFTGQMLPTQKAYVVHKPSEQDNVEISRIGQISITRELPEQKGKLRSEFYLFEALLGWRPVTWDDVIIATRELLKWMPEGDYFIYSELHGEISTPHKKHMLVRLLMRFAEEYNEKEFAGTILGFKRVADKISPNKEYEQLYKRRQSAQESRRKKWNALRRRAERKHKR